jgi:hypothetical protein
MKDLNQMDRIKSIRAIGSHHSAKMLNDEWLTPPYIIEQLGPFDLDPCAPIVRHWNTAKRHLTIEDNGLLSPWGENEFVWCNPPYGLEATRWLELMAIHNNGIALIFARTETKMFFDFVWSVADSLLFIEGRLHFHYVDGTRAKANSGAPSVLVAYGKEASMRLTRSAIKGKHILL